MVKVDEGVKYELWNGQVWHDADAYVLLAEYLTGYKDIVYINGDPLDCRLANIADGQKIKDQRRFDRLKGLVNGSI